MMEEYPLEKFTNEEFYYMISSLLSLGDPGFVPERLYMSFDQNQLGPVQDIKFLFLTKNLIYTDEGEKEVTEYSVGKIDQEFDNIEIYRWQCDPKVMSPERPKVNVNLVRSTLCCQNSPLPFRPVSFLKGVNRIKCENEFDKRNDNDLFNLKWHLDIACGIQHQFDFGEIGRLGTNFSGNYFLIVQPDKVNTGRLIVNTFHVSLVQVEGLLTLDSERVHVSENFIDSTSIQLYDSGGSNTTIAISRRQNAKRYQEHKNNMMSVLTETVLSLLLDLSPSMREKLLENETPEELIIFCKEKYDSEFDLNVDSLGIAGAHEIAWLEALAILKVDQPEF
ncbi:MAG: hypothetical protein JSS79_18160 [Bacteroidetes bacterium]|nr:hypothetical protein [Bacteroidota bacterium]